MSVWTSTPTQKGLALQSKLLSTDKLEITRVVSGAGSVPVGQLSAQTAVSDIKQELAVESLTYDKNGKGLLRVMINNYSLLTGYSMNQIGIYAEDPDEGEILYVIAQVTDVADKIPSITEQPAGFTCGWAFRLTFCESSNISITITPDAFITSETADLRYAAKNHSHDGYLNADEANKQYKSLRAYNLIFFSDSNRIDLNDYTDIGDYLFVQETAMVDRNDNLTTIYHLIDNLPGNTFDNQRAYPCAVRLTVESLTDENEIPDWVQEMTDEIGDDFGASFPIKKQTLIVGRYCAFRYQIKSLFDGYVFEDWHLIEEHNADRPSTQRILNYGADNRTISAYAIVGGKGNVASMHQTVLGKYADTSSTTDKGGLISDNATTGSLFVIGNGTAEDSRANVFRASASGRCYGTNAFGSSGADSGEFFEWVDGNLNKEDRMGLFVTLDGNRIRLATSEDDYILGVVSHPDVMSFVGNTASEEWCNKWQRDVFGRFLTEQKTIPAYTDDEGVKHEETQATVRILNPDWDKTQVYVPREERPEWDAVCFSGQVIVVDDGTCKVNGYCSASANGIATASETGYRVIKRIDDTHIKILFR